MFFSSLGNVVVSCYNFTNVLFFQPLKGSPSSTDLHLAELLSPSSKEAITQIKVYLPHQLVLHF
jgi:hypothetical protein